MTQLMLMIFRQKLSNFSASIALGTKEYRQGKWGLSQLCLYVYVPISFFAPENTAASVHPTLQDLVKHPVLSLNEMFTVFMVNSPSGNLSLL